MKLDDLIIKGHFPRELPPPFTTKYFGDYYLKSKSSLPTPIRNSRGIKFSCPKIGLIRKLVVVTNPQHQTPLSEFIVSKWTDIETHYKKSIISSTKPILTGNRAANLPEFKNYSRKCFEESYYHKYELRTDISKYYPTIYTHSIPWAIHTKAVAKANVAAKKKDWGDKIDELLRYTQYNQTIGIPIGPDTSYVISEIIGSSIDEIVQTKMPALVGHRFIDDMHFYFETHAQAEVCLKEIQHTLRDLELQINNEKTKISKLPKGIEKDWVITLRKFNFDSSTTQQRNDLYSYFSLAFEYSNTYQDQAVLSYAIKRIQNQFIQHKNFGLYESMLYKTIQAEGSTLPDVLKILLSYKPLVDKTKLKNTIQELIKFASPRAYDFEVAWALWYAITFQIKLDDSVSKELEQIIDPLTTVMIFDMIDQKLITAGVINTKKWTSQINSESLTDEKWILAYEMAVKKWETLTWDYIDKETDNAYYKILKDNGVTFYDKGLQVAVNNDFTKEPTPTEKKAKEKETEFISTDY